MGTKKSRRGPSRRILPDLTLGPDEVEARLRAFFPRSQVVLAYLFGSCARGEAKPSSDVDIAVLLEGCGAQLYQGFRELIVGIREVLGTERFDLLLLNDAPPPLKFEVMVTGCLLYARSECEQNAFEEAVLRTYLDTAHLRAIQNEYLRERARAWYSEKRR